MMSDLRAFTTLTEQQAPADVVRLLNRYLGAMTDIILEHGGTIDEFIGDAILAVFGAPRHHGDDPDRAIRCALAMQNAMTRINAANAAEGMPPLSMGIALNTGRVIAGNIGSRRRSKYGFVGHAMNVTARLEDHCGGDEIVASSATLEAASGHYHVGPERLLQVKGIDENLSVRTILGAGR